MIITINKIVIQILMSFLFVLNLNANETIQNTKTVNNEHKSFIAKKEWVTFVGDENNKVSSVGRLLNKITSKLKLLSNQNMLFH